MYKAHLFIPCFVDQLYPQTAIATVRLLEQAGVEIYFPYEQTCCGQPCFNSGFNKDSLALAERFITIFADAEAIVCPSASCISMIRKQYDSLDLCSSIRNIYDELRDRVYELSEYLVDVIKVSDFGAEYPHKVAYHASCHGYREQNILEQPLQLLKKVKGINLVELDDRRQCCGFGGTFATKFPELSAAIGEDKIEHIINSEAEVVTATDDSCLMHIEGLLSRNKIPIKTLHYARILAGGELTL